MKPPRSSQQLVTVRGVTLNVHRAGHGPAFLWAHGLTSSIKEDHRRGLYDWTILEEEHEVITFDARGHGDSGFTCDADDYQWENLARDVLALAHALGLDEFDLGGVSMGAASALWAAVLDSSSVRTLTLLGLPTAQGLRREVGERYQASAHIAEKYGLSELSRRAALVPPPAIYAADRERVHTQLTVSEEAVPYILRGAAASDLPADDLVRSIDRPALVLSWRKDPGHPVSVGEHVASTLPRGTLSLADELSDILEWPVHVRAFLER
jgi:3-oxoadipate enol-lactonase